MALLVSRDDETSLVFLPTDLWWQAPAYLHYFYAGGKPGWIERVITVLRSWDERYGAELMAHLGNTVLEFVVERPPLTLEDAWPLAREHQLIGPSTLAKPMVPLRIHARALVGRPTWRVWEQP